MNVGTLGVGIGGEDGGEGVEDDSGVAGRDLQGLGDDGGIDAVGVGNGAGEEAVFEGGEGGGGVGEDKFGDGKKAVLESLAAGVE